jgi:hypothetical protein
MPRLNYVIINKLIEKNWIIAAVVFPRCVKIFAFFAF